MKQLIKPDLKKKVRLYHFRLIQAIINELKHQFKHMHRAGMVSKMICCHLKADIHASMNQSSCSSEWLLFSNMPSLFLDMA